MPRPDYNREADKFVIAFDHAALTATTTFKLYKVPAGRTLRVDSVSYINPTGLVGDATNAFAGTLQNASTVIATLFNTDTGDVGGASLAADTFVAGTMAAASADACLDAAEILSVVFTEDAAATLPAGRLVVEVRLF